MKKKRFWKKLIFLLSFIATGMFTTTFVWGADTIPVNEKDGTVETTSYDGPQVTKIRVLQEANYLEIYWDRYVAEEEAIDVDNFVLKNGDTTLTLEPKGTDWTNTLYFDQANQEIASTSANCMARLDSDLHMSSIYFYGNIDNSQEITLEIIGDTIVDTNGKSAQSTTYTNIPYISFYTQTVVSDTGIVVKGDDTVAYTSLIEAAKQIDVMLAKTDTHIAENMAKYNCSLAVYSPHQNVYLIPEHRYGFNKNMYDVEGYGGNLYNNCVSSIAEQNIIRTRDNSSDGYMNTMYRNENILIHEFGHCVRSVGMDLLEDPTLKNEFLAVYDHAKRTGLWPNTYAISNSDEFFATMCTIWFNVMDEASSFSDGTRSPINTRYELMQYDPHTYEFFAQILPDTTLPSPWNADVPDRYHDENYDSEWIPAPEPPDSKKSLKKAIWRTELINPELYAESASTILETSISDAKDVYYAESATQLEIDLTVAKLARIASTLPPSNNNFGITADASTSFVSSWESLSAVNDGNVPETSYNPGIARYGSWGNPSASETITYTWKNPVSLNGAAVYFWYDGTENNYTSGGIKVPTAYYYEYLDDNGNWQAVENPSSYELAMDTFNSTSFDEVTTTALRITLRKQANDSNGVGIMEWEVYGEFASCDKSELEAVIQNAEALNENDYTAESWRSFQQVAALAKELLAEDLVSQEELQLAINALESEQTNLVENTAIILPYKDVTTDDWFYDAVYYNYKKGLMTGMNDTTFAPFVTLSRAQLAAILYRMEGSPDMIYHAAFSDVPDGQWYTDAIIWASQNGIVKGYGNTGKFGPDDNVTREQMIIMMHRYAGYKNMDTSASADLSTYADYVNVSDYAETAVKWAVGSGIISGKSGGKYLDPHGFTLRAECAAIIQNFY